MWQRMWSKQRVGLLAVLTIVLVLGLSVTAGATGTVIFVDTTAQGSGDGSSWENACTLQSAIASAGSGDQIWVKGGTYSPGSNRSDTFTLNDGVQILGGFAGTETDISERPAVWEDNQTILSGELGDSGTNLDNTYSIVTISGSATNSAVLDGFIISGGYNDLQGAGINNAAGGSPTLSRLVIQDCAVGSLDGSTSNCRGAGMYDTGSPVLNHVTFSHIRAAADPANFNIMARGAGLFTQGSPTLDHVTFHDCAAESDTAEGGALFGNQADITMTDVTFDQCYVSGPYSAGGALYNSDSAMDLNIVTFSGNWAEGEEACGGALYNNTGSVTHVTLDGVTFTGNYVHGDYVLGGAFAGFVYGHGFNNLIFRNNQARVTWPSVDTGGDAGGGALALWAQGEDTYMTNVEFTGNEAVDGAGGAISAWNELNITNGQFQGNIASGDHGSGGAVYTDDILRLASCSFVDNDADATSGLGGAVYSKNIVDLNGVIMAGNSAWKGGALAGDGSGACIQATTSRFLSNSAAFGGAISIGHNSSVSRVGNSLFAGNSASDSGGGIHTDAASLPLTNVTMANNSAINSGGAYFEGGYAGMGAVITNSILWGNTAADGPQISTDDALAVVVQYSDVDANPVDVRHSYLGYPSVIHDDPRFVDPEGEFGLMEGSPAIDAGDNDAYLLSTITLDLAGRLRVMGGTVDMGCYEYPQAADPFFTSATETTFIAGQDGYFAITTVGWPSDTTLELAADDTLPHGVTFVNDVDGEGISLGSATLSGTPTWASGDPVSYTLHITASNSTGTAEQTFTLLVQSPPEMVTQPDSVTKVVSETASFTATAVGAPNPTVRWQASYDGGKTWNDQSVTTTTLTTGEIDSGMNGWQYRAIFTNAVGSVTSDVAILTVNPAVKPLITTEPKDTAVLLGKTAIFTAAASGPPTPTVQWYSSGDGKRWTPITDAIGPTYTISAASKGMNGTYYKARFTNWAGSTETRAAKLVVTSSDAVLPEADLTIAQTTPTPGTGTVTWNVTLANAGPATATGVVITDTLCSGTKFDSVDPISGVTGVVVTKKGSKVIITIPSVAITGSTPLTIAIHAVITKTGATLSNLVTVSSTTTDPYPADNVFVWPVAGAAYADAIHIFFRNMFPGFTPVR